MDPLGRDSEYPDPQAAAYVAPYSAPYPNEYAPAAEGPYGDPQTGGLWQSGPAPLFQDGLDGPEVESDADEGLDSDDDLRGVFARFEMNSILQNGTNTDQASRILNPSAARDPDLDEGDDELQIADDGAILDAPSIDPDFEVQNESDSDSDMSFDEAILDQILSEGRSGRFRGRGRPRARGRGRGTGRGRKGWKWALKGTEHDPDRTRNTTRGRPRGRARGAGGTGRGGYKRTADPGEEFKKQQALATEKYVSGDLEGAAELARAAVRANPEIFAAHSLLSEVLLAQGKAKDSLTVLLAGAHTKRDPELWHHVAQRTRELAGPKADVESLDAAAYCYGWAIKLNPKDYEARRQRLNLLLESFALTESAHTATRARTECRSMLKLRPSDILVAREYAELAVLANSDPEMKGARSFYDEAMNIHSKSSSLGLNPSEDEQWNHALAYIGLIERLDGNKEAIKHFKRLARWIQQRRSEVFWDDYLDDDREFDAEDSPRKEKVAQYKSATSGNGSIEAPKNSNLPMDMRIKLGLYRLALGEQHLEEALRHFNYLIAEDSDVAGLADLFRDVADALKDKFIYHEAIRLYEPLQNVPEALDVSYYMDLATCYMNLDRIPEAEDCYKIVVENNELDWEARVALAKIYEDQGRRAEALPLIREVIALGRDDALRKNRLFGPVKDIRKEQRKQERKRNATILQEAADAETAFLGRRAYGSTNAELYEGVLEIGDGDVNRPLRRGRRIIAKTRRKPQQSGVSNSLLDKQRNLAEKLRQMKSANERVQSHYDVVQSCEEDIAAGNEDAIEIWKTAVESMLQEFKASRFLYSAKEKDKRYKFSGYGKQGRMLTEMEQWRDSLEDKPNVGHASQARSMVDPGLPNEFCDIQFPTWLDLFCSYAIQLAHEGSRDQAFSVLEDGFACNVFYHSQVANYQLHTTILACALLLDDEERLTTASRWFMNIFPTSSASYQMFAGVHRLYSGMPNWFNAGPTQKYLMRAVKSFDYYVLPPEKRKEWNFEKTMGSGTKTHEWAKVDELDAGLLALYGHVMAAAQTWSSALNYYYRALAMRPNDPMLLLCIGLSYVQGAMKRQAENRHWSIMMGLGFLGKYKRIRKEMAKSTGRRLYEQEAEYNVARAWHFLGLDHLAVGGYHKCLRIRDEMGQVPADKDVDAMDVDGEEDEAHVEEFTQEAALALVNIYVLTEQPARAREITEEYMVI